MPLDSPVAVPPTGAVLQSFDILGVAVPQNAVVGVGIVTIVGLIVLSAFFSSSEIAMFSLLPTGRRHWSKTAFRGPGR